MLTLYWAPNTRAMRALWMLEELGQPYERVLVDIRNGGQTTPDYHRINPMEKVPALTDGPVAVAESGAVLAYLADRYPQAGLAPAFDDPRRGRYLQWLFFSGNCIEPAVGELAGGKGGGNSVQNGWGTAERVMSVLDEALQGGPWLLGEAFSAADVLIGIDLNFLGRIMKLLPETPAMAAYVDRCVARPAFQRAAAIDQAAAAAQSGGQA